MLKRPRKYHDLADPQARPRYTGIASFFRAPHTDSLAETDIGLIGVPFDGGVTNRTGARHGPRAVRDQSSLLRRFNARDRRCAVRRSRGCAIWAIAGSSSRSRWKARWRRSPTFYRRRRWPPA